MTVSCNNGEVIRPGNRHFTKCLKVCVLIAIASLVFADKADALVVPSQNTSGGIYFIDNDIAERLGEERLSLLLQQHLYLRIDRDLSGYYSMVYHYPWWQYADFKEGDNIEWIYNSLENQYSFLDNELYKLSGANYFLGPVWAPSWHGFDDIYWAAGLKKRLPGIQRKKLRVQTIDSDGKYFLDGETYRPGLSIHNLSTPYMEDIISGGLTNQFQIRNINSVLTNDGGIIAQDMAAIPEPSVIILFGLVGLKVLVRRRKVN